MTQRTEDIVEKLEKPWPYSDTLALMEEAATEITRLRQRLSELDWCEDMGKAPRDGTWIEAYRPAAPGGFWQRIIVCRWDDEFGCFVWPDSIFDIYEQDLTEKDAAGYFKHDVYEAGDTLTHWRPLPPIPTRKEEAPPEVKTPPQRHDGE